MSWASLNGNDLTIRNLTVSGSLTMTNVNDDGVNNDTVFTNLISNPTQTTSINMNNGGNSINLTGFAINNYGIVSCSSNINMNNADAIIGGAGVLNITSASGSGLNLNNNKTSGDLNLNSGSTNCNVVVQSGNINMVTNSSIYGLNNIAFTNASGFNTYINGGKTSGDLVINVNSPASDVIISSGNLLMNTMQLNPIEYIITNGQANTYYWSQIQKSFSTIFVAQSDYGGNVGLILDSPVTDGVELTVVCQMPVTYALTIYNETGFDFYGNIAGGNTVIALQNNDFVVLKAIAGLWYVITIKL